MVAPGLQGYIETCGFVGPTGRKAHGPPQHGLLRELVTDPVEHQSSAQPLEKDVPHWLCGDSTPKVVAGGVTVVASADCAAV